MYSLREKPGAFSAFCLSISKRDYKKKKNLTQNARWDYEKHASDIRCMFVLSIKNICGKTSES